MVNQFGANLLPQNSTTIAGNANANVTSDVLLKNSIGTTQTDEEPIIPSQCKG